MVNVVCVCVSFTNSLLNLVVDLSASPECAGSHQTVEPESQESNRQTCRAAPVLHYSATLASKARISEHLHGGSRVWIGAKEIEKTET